MTLYFILFILFLVYLVRSNSSKESSDSSLSSSKSSILLIQNETLGTSSYSSFFNGEGFISVYALRTLFMLAIRFDAFESSSLSVSSESSYTSDIVFATSDYENSNWLLRLSYGLSITVLFKRYF